MIELPLCLAGKPLCNYISFVDSEIKNSGNIVSILYKNNLVYNFFKQPLQVEMILNYFDGFAYDIRRDWYVNNNTMLRIKQLNDLTLSIYIYNVNRNGEMSNGYSYEGNPKHINVDWWISQIMNYTNLNNWKK